MAYYNVYVQDVRDSSAEISQAENFDEILFHNKSQ